MELAKRTFYYVSADINTSGRVIDVKILSEGTINGRAFMVYSDQDFLYLNGQILYLFEVYGNMQAEEPIRARFNWVSFSLQLVTVDNNRF